MRKHLNQYVFSPLFWVMSLLLATLFILVVLLFTPFGPQTIAVIVESSFNQLKLKGVSGSILTGLHIDELSWEAETGIVIKDIDINVKKYEINKDRVFADTVSVGQLSINLTNNQNEPGSSGDLTTLPDFSLPINLDAETLQLKSLRITRSIPDDPGSQTLLFQIKDIQLQKVDIKNNGQLKFGSLQGDPIILDEPLKINVSNGSMNMDQPHEINTSGKVSFDHSELGSLNGSISVKGTLTQYLFESDLNLEQKLFGKDTIQIKGQGDYKQVSFEQVLLDSVHGKAKAVGKVVWDPEVRWKFNVDAENISSEKLLPDWPVIADAKLDYRGSYLDSRLENQVNILSLLGDFRDQRLTGTGQITEREGLIRLNNLDVKLGDNQVFTNGAITEPLNLNLIINAEKLKQVIPELSGRVQGTATIKGSYTTPEIKTKLISNDLVYQDFKQSTEALQLDADMGVEEGALQLKNLIVKAGSNNIQIKGRAIEPFDLKWAVDARKLDQLSPELSGNVEGNGALTGTFDKPESTFKISAKGLAFKDIKQGNEELILQGGIALNEGVIEFKSLEVKSASNELLVSGKASEPLDIDIKLNAQDLSKFTPDLAGRVQGDGKITGKYDAPLLKIKNTVASKLQFKGIQLSNAELRLQGEAQLVDGVPMVKALNAQIGENRLQLSGRASSPFDLKWNIDSKNLKQIMPELSGSLLVNGQLGGTIDKPLINAKVDAKNILYKEFKLDSADFSANTNNGIYRIKGNLKKLETAGQKISDANLELNGRIDNHNITALINLEQAKLNLKANGAWINQKWNGSLQNLQVLDSDVGDWKLQKPARVTFSENSFSSDNFCIGNEKTQACTTASYAVNTGLTAKGTLREAPLGLLKPFLPESIEFNGTANGSYDIKQNNGNPIGTINFKLPKNSFLIKGEDDDSRMFTYEDAEINATINNRTVKVQTAMKVVNRGDFSSKAILQLSPENGRHTIEGSANFDIPNINFAQELIPRSRGLRGALTSNITFSGLLSKPQIKGQAEIKNGYLRLPEAGTELTKIKIKVKADKPGQAVINGKMQMGEGVLTVTGDMNLKDILKWKANIKLSGKDIRFMNTNEIKATMSPDLSLRLSPELVSIKGKVIIPQADIRLKEIPETSIDESSDAFVVGERKPGEQISAVKLQPNVKIELGNKVRLDAFGLKARLSGGVNVTHNRRDVLANGSLRITEGKFQAYGQNLEINNGRLIFNGSPKLVGMDIRATREIDNQIVGVHLGGTLRNPKSKIFSEPSLSESEALSFLLTGHSLSTSSGQESALLMSAVRGLGITGSGSLIQNIGSSFGLDDVNIVSKEDLEQSELSLGKRLGSGLYVQYLLGLFEQTQKIAIKYKINKVLSLEAHTTVEDYSLDLIYEIERD